jgi:hypothetical protein
MALRVEVPETQDQLHDWARQVVNDARDRRRGHELMWWEQLCVYAGDLWVEYNPHSGRLMEVPAPDHKVRLPINLVNPTVRTEYAKLLKNRPLAECVARSDDKNDLDAAKMGDKILNHYVEKQFDMLSVRREALIWALTCGLGAIFVDYDPNAMGEIEVMVGPDGSPVFDPEAIKQAQQFYKDQKHAPKTITIPQGDLRVEAVGPMNWGWDFSKRNPRKAKWCYITEVYDALEVEQRWGVEVEVHDSDVQANLLERRILERADLTSYTATKGSLTNPTSQDLVKVHRMFVLPGHKYFPQGAEIVFTDHEFIDASKFPFGHNRLPISCMGHIPFPSSNYPLSVVSQIRDPNLELAKTESQMVENRNLMGNPPWVFYKQHNIPEGKIVNKPGLQIEVDYRPNMPDPHPVEMPDLPQYVKDLPTLLETHIQTIAGQGETAQGRVPPGARSGVAIAYLQEEDDTKLGPTVGEYEEMIERVAWQQLHLIAERYDAPRTARIPRPHALPDVFDFIGSMLSGVAAVQVQAGSALPRSKAARQQFFMDLYSMGAETDPRKLKQELELGEGEPDPIAKDEMQAERENDLMETGKMAPVKDWFNHEVHIRIHRDYMKSVDYEVLPPELQDIFDQHDAMHQRYLTGAAQAGQVGIPTPGQGDPTVQPPGGLPAPTANGTQAAVTNAQPA